MQKETETVTVSRFRWFIVAMATFLPIPPVLSWAGPRQEAAPPAENPTLKYVRQPEVEAEVQRQPDNRLILRWKEDGPVTIFRGTAPEQIDRTKPIAVVTDKKEAVVEGLPQAKRPYFLLVFGKESGGKTLVVAERFLPLTGAANFRDVGGYRTKDGKMVRWGKVYRTNALNRLTPEDVTYLAENVGLVKVCDFRGAQEIEAAPSRWPETRKPDVVNLAIASDSNAMRSLLPALMQGDEATLRTAMKTSYVEMVETRGAEVFGPFLKLFADTKNLPVAFHCTAGKDRTGVGTALLLGLLNVPDETIIADYTLSNYATPQLMQEMKENKRLMAAFGANFSKLTPLLGAEADWIAGTLAHIRTKYGSVENYCKQKAGLDDGTIAKIRANLLP